MEGETRPKWYITLLKFAKLVSGRTRLKLRGSGSQPTSLFLAHWPPSPLLSSTGFDLSTAVGRDSAVTEYHSRRRRLETLAVLLEKNSATFEDARSVSGSFYR